MNSIRDAESSFAVPGSMELVILFGSSHSVSGSVDAALLAVFTASVYLAFLPAYGFGFFALATFVALAGFTLASVEAAATALLTAAALKLKLAATAAKTTKEMIAFFIL